MTFETSVSRLEAIVSELQSDDLPLDRALALFQEGIECLRVAQSSLSKAEAQVKLLAERADGSFDLRDFRG